MRARSIIRFGSRLARASAAASLLVGCSHILDISEPNARPLASAGEAGESGSEHSPDTTSAGAESAGEAGARMTDGAGGMSVRGVGEAGVAGDDSDVHGGSSGSSGASGGVGGASGSSGGSGGASGGSGGASGGTAGSGGVSGATGTVQPVCTTGQNRCDPGSPKTPQVCSAAGQWIKNTAQGNGADCPVACSATTGLCVECQGTDKGCKDNYPSTCVNGAWSHSSPACTNFCSNGDCQYPSSCGGAQPTCGPGSADSCCLSFEVTGGAFNRINNATYNATISTFTMDKYEVAVSRFARYVTWLFSALGAPPLPGSGKMAHNPYDLGWQAAYPLPATHDAMVAQLSTTCPDSTFGMNGNLPENCVDFYLAYAFCIWDGGRLPTEAEWNYAAAGGDQQRFFPWSSPPPSTVIDASDAAYLGTGGLKPVGTFVNGYGRYGQADLGGNVAEWTLDYSANILQAPCTDCLNMAVDTNREVRGGSYLSMGSVLRTTQRSDLTSDATGSNIGFRCVHDL